MITVIFFELVKNLPWILLILCLFSCYLKSTSLLTKYEIKVSIIAMAQIQTDQKLWQLLLKLFDFSDASVQVFFLVNSTLKHALSNFCNFHPSSIQCLTRFNYFKSFTSFILIEHLTSEFVCFLINWIKWLRNCRTNNRSMPICLLKYISCLQQKTLKENEC